MKVTSRAQRRGIRWTLTICLEKLDFPDDLCLLSSNHKDISTKTYELDKNSKKIGLKIHPSKSKVMKLNSNNKQPITINGENIEEVENFM